VLIGGEGVGGGGEGGGGVGGGGGEKINICPRSPRWQQDKM